MNDLYDELNIGRSEYEIHQIMNENEESSSEKIDLFKGYIKSILSSDQDFRNYKNYVPFVVNKHLSFSSETVEIANIMNRYHRLPKRIQFNFFRLTIKKGNAYRIKWMPKDSDDKINIIRKAYKYSYEKAKDVLPLLSDEQIEILKTRIPGG